jgi:hypothetical protein
MQMAGGGGGFLQAAQQGMFAIDMDSGRNMVMSIQQMRDELDDRLTRIQDLKVKAKLGDLPEAHAIADLNVKVASGDHQSLEEALIGFRDALEEAQHALEIGMKNYKQVDADAEHGVGRISP